MKTASRYPKINSRIEVDFHTVVLMALQANVSNWLRRVVPASPIELTRGPKRDSRYALSVAGHQFARATSDVGERMSLTNSPSERLAAEPSFGKFRQCTNEMEEAPHFNRWYAISAPQA